MLWLGLGLPYLHAMHIHTQWGACLTWGVPIGKTKSTLNWFTRVSLFMYTGIKYWKSALLVKAFLLRDYQDLVSYDPDSDLDDDFEVTVAKCKRRKIAVSSAPEISLEANSIQVDYMSDGPSSAINGSDEIEMIKERLKTVERKNCSEKLRYGCKP